VAAALTLSPATRRAFERLAADCARVLGGRVVAVIATTPDSSVVFAEPIRAGDLEALGALVDNWHRDGLDTPLLLTPEEFRRSLDAFPIEYQAIIDRHVVVSGAPPFQAASVPVDRLRDACEVQAKGHLIHLRQGWIDAAGHDERLAALLARSATPLRVLLSNVARLNEPHGAHDDGRAMAGARLAGLPENLIRDVLALEEAPERAEHLLAQLPQYLQAAEQLWAFVDGWRSR
jgi:hypothetical protein